MNHIHRHVLIKVNVPVPDQSYCLVLHLDAPEARLLQLSPHSSELVSQTLVRQNLSQCRAQASYICWGDVGKFSGTRLGGFCTCFGS